MNIRYWIKLASGPILFLLVVFVFPLDANNPNVTLMAAVTLWIAAWWLTEVVDLAVTSLLPLVLLPSLGILDAKTTALQYNDQIIFLFVGGFILSFAIEKWQLHKRISLRILSLIGSSPSMILFGVMFTTYFISMWMSNTATVMMLLAAVLAIIYHIEQVQGEEKVSEFSSSILLGLAYAASIGGMATLVGTPTNMIFYGFYKDHVPGGDINFTSWFARAFPVSIALLIAAFFILRKKGVRPNLMLSFDKGYFRKAYKSLGAFTYEEKWVVGIFSTVVLLWFTRSDINFGSFSLYGWNNLFEKKEFLQDSTVAIFGALLLFLIPSKNKKSENLLVWDDAKKIPYDIILLFGSGFALSKGFEVSGLSTFLANKLLFLKGTNPLFLIFAVCVIVCVISEFASNVASIQLVLPILLSLSSSLEVDPLLLMIPATLAASLGYMLPVATAANTIVFGTRKVPLKEMLSRGLWIDVVGILIITLAAYLLL